MRVERISLPAYGPFTGFQLDLTATGKLHLVYGLNEAGKSSLLRGIQAAFFDYPTQCHDDFVHPYGELRAGAILVNASGNRLAFARRKGTRNTLLGTDDRLVPEAEFNRFLDGMQESVFQTLFGLNHQLLQEGGRSIVNGEGEVAKLLFEAGGFPRMTEVSATLEKAAKDVFGAGNSQKSLNVKLREIQKLRTEVRQTALRPDDYNERRRALDQHRTRLQEIRKRRQEIVIELQILDRVENNKSDLVEHAIHVGEISSLGALPDLPADFTKRRVEAEQRLRTAQEEIASNEEALKTKQRLLANFPADFPLMQHSAKIAALLSGTGNYRTQAADRKKLVQRSITQKETASAKWAELMPDRSLSDLETFMWSAPQIAEFQNLCDQAIKLESEQHQLTEELRAANDEAQQLQLEIEQLPAEIDTQKLDAILATVEAQSHEKREREFAKELENLVSKRDRALRQLSWWAGNVEQVSQVVAPPIETIAQYESAFAALENEKRALAEKQLVVEAECVLQRGKLNALVSQGEVPTEERLYAEREHRDRGWSLIRRSAFKNEFSLSEAEANYEAPKPLDEAFERHLHAADEIADKLRIDSKRAAEFTLSTEALRVADEAKIELEEKNSQLSKELGELIADWKREWTGLTFEVRTPSEMRAWDVARKACVDLLLQTQERERDLQSEIDLMGRFRASISIELRNLRQPDASDTETLSALAIRAMSHSERCRKNREALKSKRDGLSRVNLRIPKLEDKLLVHQRKSEGWKERWQAALSKASAPDTSIPEVKASISSMPSIRESWNAHKEAERRITGIDDQMEDYRKQVSVAVDELAPELKDLNPDTAVDHLHQRLKTQQAESNEKQKCLESIEVLQNGIIGQRKKIESSEEEVRSLCQLAGCSSAAELSAIEKRIQNFREKEKLRQQLEVGLLKRNPGKNLDAIRVEAAEYQNESLSIKRLSLQGEDNEADANLQKCYAEIAALETQISGDEASTRHVELSQELQVKVSEARALAILYARTRIQQLILQEAADRFRKGHEAPVLKRASEIFSALTLGGFSGLTTDYSDNGKILKAVRAVGGKQLEMKALSDGTADQLFLSLRLAAIEDYARTHDTFPCIFDDILVNSDDLRTAATLRELARFALQHQVLLFTHHDHILRIAEQEVGDHIVVHHLSAAAAVGAT